jgi:hypothetical protein
VLPVGGTNWTASTAISSQYLAVNCEPWDVGSLTSHNPIGLHGLLLA